MDGILKTFRVTCRYLSGVYTIEVEESNSIPDGALQSTAPCDSVAKYNMILVTALCRLNTGTITAFHGE